MNTAERRWMIVAPVGSEADWERVHFTIADFAVEAIVETEAGAEIYFVVQGEAAACAEALGLADGPRISGEGTGEVFGQQSHPTTELCLALMPSGPVALAADIGSGTGRLALAAVHRGAQFTVAVDADWPAARATHEVLRGTSSAYALQASANALRTGTFDLILANLHLSLWRELAPEIARIAARNAVLVASGFLEAQLAEVETMLSSTGWRITDRSFRDSWFAIRASRSV